jgi:Ketopantoate reductase PanE/ApbA C terminal
MTLTDLHGLRRAHDHQWHRGRSGRTLTGVGALVQARAPLLRMSSLHDLEHRRPLEIEETLGYVVTEAATMGLAVPTVDTCYRLMRGLNRCMQRARGSPCWRCGAEGISQGMGPTPSKVRSCLTAASSGGAPSASGSSVLFTSTTLLKHIAQESLTTRTDGSPLLCFLPHSPGDLCYDELAQNHGSQALVHNQATFLGMTRCASCSQP